jgi:hypothetical protein
VNIAPDWLLLAESQSRDGGIGVVGKADAIDAVGGLQLSCRNQFGLRVARDDGTVDGTFNLIGFNRKCDLLRYWLSTSAALCTAAFSVPWSFI